MFGQKAKRIKELEKENAHLREVNEKFRIECTELRSKNWELEYTTSDLKDELEKIKPVVETSGFKPAVTDKCGQCKFAYYSDYDDELMGCCKGMVCDDFEPYREKE